MSDTRPLAGAWTYRFGFSVVVFGYGISVGPLLTEYRSHRHLAPLLLFRNYAYRRPW